MKQEIWKDIENYEWKYQVSNLWNIKSLPKKWSWWHNWKILKLWKHKEWYLQICLYKDWIGIGYRIHRLVCMTFLDNTDNKLEVNHINWIKHDNRVENLEWCNKSENMIHSYKNLWNKSFFKNNNPSKWRFWINHHTSKKINQYDLQWNFIKTWNCISDIQRELWVNNGNITSCCKKSYWYKTSWWYKWEYYLN